MERVELSDFNQDLPDKLPVSVVMEKRPSDHQWIDYTYEVIGVIPGEQYESQQVKKIHQEEGAERYLVSGLSVQMYADECESYYHNLMSPQPGCFVVAGEAEELEEMPIPYLVSMSFDEVHAYLEGDEQVYAVEMPPELYKWTEAFVLTHYVATKKTKRKLQNWNEQATGKIVHQQKSV